MTIQVRFDIYYKSKLTLHCSDTSVPSINAFTIAKVHVSDSCFLLLPSYKLSQCIRKKARDKLEDFVSLCAIYISMI
ncbi:hypothetical protein V1477_003470 [Vespula maculifrons]|uniref:Uncharacterized protein n=1 Tax=Vespula maculifrons TaxID=7453 RepID=A0ABD2CST6_VESMC